MNLESTDPADFFITSDTFFGRDQILQIANRFSFNNIRDMESKLIKNWNSVVTDDDSVIQLGNFAWDPITARRVIAKLNGTISFMVGHCDDALVEAVSEFDHINIIEDQIVMMPEHDLVLCHYPLKVWPGKDSGTIHIHGHTVFSHKTNLDVELRINACTDFWGYHPIKLSTFKDIIDETTQKNIPGTSI